MPKFPLLLAIAPIASSSVVKAQQPELPVATSSQYLLEIYVLPNVGPDYLSIDGPYK